jgi:hypothetical protein
MATHQFKTTNIKGKQYVEVNERVKAFKSLSEYKDMSMETEIVQLTDDTCVIRALIKDSSGRILATGMAQEDKSSSRINQTSYVENCETSAVGRALGFVGIGIDTSIATSDEVDLAIKKQETTKAPATVKSPAKTQDTASSDVSDVFSQSIDYLKNTPSDKKETSYEMIISKHGDKFSEKQRDALKKFM